jgi:hypothetical protein
MVRGEANSYPVQLLVNYWEIRPSEIAARLDELMRQRISHVATFVPWQGLESDISHKLTRILLAAAERKISISLILTPEVGVHYPYSGMPKDLVTKPEVQACHQGNGPVICSLPPNRFALPSISAQEFNKRYYSFLARIDGILADFSRTYGKQLDTVNLVLTGSFWKYYRSPRHSAQNPFQGVAGDFSGPAMLEYRHRVEHFYSQPEFSDPTPAAANRWKTQVMEEANQRWFNQQSEAVFRNRTVQQLRRKAAPAHIREVELFTPEADPSISYLQFLETIAGGTGDFARMSSLIDEYAAFASHGAVSRAASFIHWTSLAGFHALSDSEKQFLILKSLLIMGGMGGGLYIDEEEWFSLSPGFRGRVEAFARAISQGELRMVSRALYLTPHLWSNAGPLWKPLFERLSVEAKMISSLDALASERDANLLILDPSFIVTREVLQKLMAWAKSGRVLVMPRTQLYTQLARHELDLGLARSKQLDIDLGVRYRLHHLGDGQLIIHDLPQALSNPNESARAWQTFLSAILSVAGVESYCKVSDARIATIPLWKKDERNLGLFVINSTKRQIAADLIFASAVRVSDLAVAVSATKASQQAAVNVDATAGNASLIAPANRFTLEVPPNGVMPLQVDGLWRGDSIERIEAAKTADALRVSSQSAAISELAGFGSLENESVFGSLGEPAEGDTHLWS